MVRQDEQARRCWPLERPPAGMFKPLFCRQASRSPASVSRTPIWQSRPSPRRTRTRLREATGA
ncbi:hypothetical protein I603_1319 [Erythrobacter dokdonensis DSW-74]|uniref:Uncharacterized protein n=1 Tax=Erythrobacter dokdonensis DSW-74 TaxID=1300349 RepID=A0A1A7BGR8_9SPHN|nr:hypothetical protein I603_1319 [Erythrobacter dokdonensis DSW-74]